MKIPVSRAGGNLTNRKAVTPSLSESNGHCIGAFLKDGFILAYDTKCQEQYSPRITSNPHRGKSYTEIGPARFAEQLPSTFTASRSLVFHIPCWISLLEQADLLLRGTVDLHLAPHIRLHQILKQEYEESSQMYTWYLQDRNGELQSGKIVSTQAEIDAFTGSVHAGDYRVPATARRLAGV